jgi:hypothetical protein
MTAPLDVRGSSRPATAFDLEWQKRADDLEFSTLPSLRSAAQKWAATVGSLTGVLGIAALVKGPSDLTKVRGSLHLVGCSIPWVGVLGVLLGLAVSAATVSIVLAALAAQGSPQEFRFAGDELRRRYRAATTRTAAQLTWSRSLAITSVPLLAAAVAVLWYATPRESAPQPVLVTTTAGATYCGQLLPSTDGLRIKINGGEQTVAAADLKSLTPLATCP